MTKKNVNGVVSDTMSGYNSISLLLKNLETERTNDSLPLDSMIISSATNRYVKSTQEDPWIVQHPSALNKFHEILDASEGKQIIMFLDYDGTLTPIVQNPDRAFMSEAMRTSVHNLASVFPTTIVTGRCIDKVYSFVQLPQLYYAGSHGMDIKGPETADTEPIMFQAASEFPPMIDEVTEVLFDKTKSITGARVENNKFCVSVHYRCVDKESWSEVEELVKQVLKNYSKLKLTQGKKVLEIRPCINWNKGKALEFLLESLGYASRDDVFPICIGDDRTDGDAFKVLLERGEGVGILVSKTAKETNASYTLQQPSEVMEFLHRLVEWKRLSCQTSYS